MKVSLNMGFWVPKLQAYIPGLNLEARYPKSREYLHLIPTQNLCFGSASCYSQWEFLIIITVLSIRLASRSCLSISSKKLMTLESWSEFLAFKDPPILQLT
jgi:hypothetical protein